jgi:hypothetical protein
MRKLFSELLSKFVDNTHSVLMQKLTNLYCLSFLLASPVLLFVLLLDIYSFTNFYGHSFKSIIVYNLSLLLL